MNRHGRIAKLDLDVRRRVIELRRHRMKACEIWERLGLQRTSEQNAVREVCGEKSLRRYQFGVEVGAPVPAGRNAGRRPMA